MSSSLTKKIRKRRQFQKEKYGSTLEQARAKKLRDAVLRDIEIKRKEEEVKSKNKKKEH